MGLVHELCLGCNRIVQDDLNRNHCSVYADPSIHWRNTGVETKIPILYSSCPLASHIERKLTETEKRRVGQQKQKKIRKRF